MVLRKIAVSPDIENAFVAIQIGVSPFITNSFAGAPSTYPSKQIGSKRAAEPESAKPCSAQRTKLRMYALESSDVEDRPTLAATDRRPGARNGHGFHGGHYQLVSEGSDLFLS